MGNMMRMILKPVIFLRQMYWRVCKPITIGVRAVIVNNDEKLLLVKHNYSEEWYLPGGKVAKGESFIDGLNRELREEIGIYDTKIESLLGIYSNFYEGKSDYIAVFVIKSFSQTNVTHFEIEKSSYFGVDELPKNVSKGTAKRINEYLNLKIIDYIW